MEKPGSFDQRRRVPVRSGSRIRSLARSGRAPIYVAVPPRRQLSGEILGPTSLSLSPSFPLCLTLSVSPHPDPRADLYASGCCSTIDCEPPGPREKAPLVPLALPLLLPPPPRLSPLWREYPLPLSLRISLHLSHACANSLRGATAFPTALYYIQRAPSL